MSVKDIARRQMQSRINKSAMASALHLQVPKEGWIALVRNALGMSGAQLGKRLSLSRGRISQVEKSEVDGRVTLRSMQELAEGLGKQSLRDEQNKAEIERLTRELIQNPPSDFWEA